MLVKLVVVYGRLAKEGLRAEVAAKRKLNGGIHVHLLVRLQVTGILE